VGASKPYLVGAAGGGTNGTSTGTERIAGSWSPFPPENLSTLDEGSTDIDLTWGPGGSVLEDTYNVYRATSSGSSQGDYTQVASGLTSTSYTDSGLTEGKTYYYRVTGQNSTGESDLSNELAATTDAPAPTFDTATVVDDNGDGNADQFDCAWTEGGTDENHYEVLGSTDGGSSFSQLGSDVPNTDTTFTTPEQRDGEEYVLKIRAVYDDAVGDSAPKTRTTALPDVATGDITPIDASVEDELTAPNAAVADNGDVRYQIRESGSGNAFGSDIVVPQGGSDATFTGLLDGERYDIRARSETEHVTGAYVEVSDVTLLPAPSIGTPTVGATEITLPITDNADNENGITVDRRQEYSDGFDAYTELANLAPDATSYTDPTALPGTTYEYRVTNYTEHVESSATIRETTDSLRPSNQAPTSGWYLEADHPSGRTRAPAVVGTPQRQPSLNSLETVEIPVPKEDAWNEPAWDDADVRVWHDGERLPIDTLVTRRQQAGRTVLVCEGGTALRESDVYEFLNTDVHAAFGAIVDDTPYGKNITDPTGDSTTFDTVDDEDGFDGYFQDPGDQDPVVIDSAGVHLSQTCHFTEAEDLPYTSFTESEFPGSYTPQWGGNEAVNVTFDSSGPGRLDYTFTLDHEIPAGDVGVVTRWAWYELDAEIFVELDGQVIYRVNATGSPSNTSAGWRDVNGVGLGSEWTTPLSIGDHTLSIYLRNFSLFTSDAGVYTDAVAVFDQRHHSSGFDESPDPHFDTPKLYPDSGVDAVFLHEGFLSATGADVTSTWDDTTGDQALALSIDNGSTYPLSASNSTTVGGDFNSSGPDVTLKVTLDAYGSRTDASPTQGFETQTLSEYTLNLDTRDSPPLSNDKFVGDRKDTLTKLVTRGDAMWGLSWDSSAEQIVVEMTNVGQRTGDTRLDLVDYQWDTQTLGRQIEDATIRGGARAVRDESFTANHGTKVQLEHAHLVPGREQVTDPSTGTIYTRGTDYVMDTYESGEIVTQSSGNITDGQSLDISYEWKPVGSFAIGGADPRNAIEEGLVGATTEAVCKSVAYYLVQELKDPVESGELVVEDLPPGWSLLQAIQADPLPNRESFTLAGQPTVQDGRVTVPVASRQSVGEVVDDLRTRLSDHSERI